MTVVYDVLITLVWLAAYFAPSFVAAYRGSRKVWSIFVINFFLGWTLIAWVVCLSMAVHKEVLDARS